MKREIKILDMTCGSRTIWFNKHHPNVVYCDKRKEEYEIAFGKERTNIHKCFVDPDVVCDFTNLPFEDETFDLIIFDPPHLLKAKETAWLVKKYGLLDEKWPDMLREGFKEGMRTLKYGGTMIFKWSEKDIARGIKEIQEGKDYISNYCPGCGKKMKTRGQEQHEEY